MQWAPYQLRWLDDQSRMRACVKSRRIGFSEVVAFECAARSLGLEFVGRRFRQIRPAPQCIVSAGGEQAKYFLTRVRSHLYPLALAFDKREPDVLLDDNKMSLRPFNGTWIRAFSANPAGLRGYEGDFIWDECGATPRAEDVWDAAKSIADAHLGNPTGYRVSVFGTPKGDTNLFHSFCRGKKANAFSQHTVTIHDAHRDGFPFTESLEAMQRGMTSEKWKQEHEADFLTASQRYIGEELYDSAKVTVAPELMPQFALNAPRFGGNDVGRVHDLSALCRLVLHDGKLWQDGLVQVERGMAFDAQERWVGREVAGMNRLAIDATGMGMQYAERMVRAHGSRIEPVTFTNALKEELATDLKLAMERGMLRLRADDTDLRDDVLLLRRQVTSAGNIRFDADRSADKGHADRAWALALAVHAAGGATKSLAPLKPHALVPRAQATDPREPVRPMVQPRRRAWE
jgi:phage FluMu gp28-like protein